MSKIYSDHNSSIILKYSLMDHLKLYPYRITAVGSLNEKLAMEQACRIAVEAISNIKTVASLGQETEVLNRYLEELLKAERECRNKIRYRGIMFGLSNSVHALGYALVNTAGGLMVSNDEIQYKIINV